MVGYRCKSKIWNAYFRIQTRHEFSQVCNHNYPLGRTDFRGTLYTGGKYPCLISEEWWCLPNNFPSAFKYSQIKRMLSSERTSGVCSRKLPTPPPTSTISTDQLSQVYRCVAPQQMTYILGCLLQQINTYKLFISMPPWRIMLVSNQVG